MEVVHPFATIPHTQGETTWSTTIDPTDPALSADPQPHTITATAIIGGDESDPSAGVSITIIFNCPPIITTPEDGDTITSNCEDLITVSGTTIPLPRK